MATPVRVGAHVSAAGRIEQCVERAQAIGAEAIQIFASGPQSWRPSVHSDEALARLRERAASAGVGPLFLHGVYLINLATADPALLARSVASLQHYLTVSAAMGAAGVIFHVGSHKGAGFDAVLPQIATAIERALAATPAASRLLLENSAGQGGSIGSKLTELGAIIDAVGSERVGVCLDTCHAYAAGLDIKTNEGLAALLADLDRAVGVDRLAAIHANDCKAGLGSGLDRHENIGQGHLGEEGFRALLAQEPLRRVPWLLETPGFTGGGPDRENVEILRRLAEEAVATARTVPAA